MKGIILAGGSGTRLYPLTKGVSKQLLPVYDKPMIYYPLSTLMLAGITDILIITTLEEQDAFIRLLGDGSQWGISLSYVIQPSPDGLAQAFILGENFIGDQNVCLILGDNIFYGSGLPQMLKKTVGKTKDESVAGIFGYYVKDPERYGVAERDEGGGVLSIEEKPEKPKSNYAIVGLYFFPNSVIEIAKKVKPSKRGELEITSVIHAYLQKKQLKMQIMGRGFAWLDTGTHEAMADATMYVQAIEKRQGLKVSCLEEIAWRKGYITKEKMKEAGKEMGKNDYGQYLLNL
ncbi:MAG: glucose-1-phosphate thymidylyltransferase RfbA [Candidatus Marinimicrobia bacterium]|nr:glucose-1-phosphate thymidylyltransferase RfbA [Candidatus Neomarinimicrobiota bacterium]